MSKTKLCLPLGVKPNYDNDWGTDSVIISVPSNILNSLKIYDNARAIWEYCIIVYTINQLTNIEENIKFPDAWWDVHNPALEIKNKLKDFHDKEKIDNITFELCNYEEYSTLDNIFNYVLNIDDWSRIITSNLPKLYLFQKVIDKTLKYIDKDRIVIFIDKVDQAIRQTSAEAPDECTICWKKDKISICKNKNDILCNDVNAACRKECCYGCEKYETPYSDFSLRVYNGNPLYNHVNIWQYLQIGLIEAVNNIKTKMKSTIEVYFTIREEAYSCEINLWNDKRQKIKNLVEELWYTKEQQQDIYNYCIKHQHEYLLFDPALINKTDKLEEAFVGVSMLCHPFVRDLSESVFDSIYRHSFDRSRDIQIYGEYLTLHMDEIRKCKSMLERGELVKKLIEEKAAELAFYFDDAKGLSNSSYYVEKIDILPNFWANPENFKRLIMMMSQNLMFASDVKNICKKFNNINGTCKDCNKCEAEHHPFSMLYKLGMLGKIKTFPEWQDNIKIEFLHSKHITYINGENVENISDGIIYVIHPALTKSIERLNVRIMHFNGFIIGKGLKVSKEKLNMLIDDKKKMKRNEFTKKYFDNR